jgi:hypothetical protein
MELMVLLQLKHWYVDFVNQSMDEVRAKGEYGNPLGLWHSIKHAFFTFLIFLLVDLDLAVALFALDFILHYHIDWVKMNYGNQDINTPQFWNHLGLDQLAHQLCYILYVYLWLLGV